MSKSKQSPVIQNDSTVIQQIYKGGEGSAFVSIRPPLYGHGIVAKIMPPKRDKAYVFRVHPDTKRKWGGEFQRRYDKLAACAADARGLQDCLSEEAEPIFRVPDSEKEICKEFNNYINLGEGSLNGIIATLFIAGAKEEDDESREPIIGALSRALKLWSEAPNADHQTAARFRQSAEERRGRRSTIMTDALREMTGPSGR